jgi:class 3 adenylate cyclase
MKTTRLKILLVEDEPADQMNFQRMVRRENLPYDYVMAATVAEARAALKRERFDIAVLDYSLADGTAFDLFDLLRDTPIIFATGRSDQDLAIRAIKAGAYDYLIKDFDRDYLRLLPMTIENASRYARQQEELSLLRRYLRDANERLDFIVHHFVPGNLVAHLIDERELPRLGGQRRTVTLLFADIRNYMTVAEMLEPEMVMGLLNRYYAVIGRIITERGGTINQYAGDQVMAIFNAPDEQPDHAIRAVRTALQVQAEVSKLNSDLPAGERVIAVQFGIGINTGPAVVGYLGFEDRFDYTALGDTTNVAARLSAAVPSGQVWIGPETFEAVHEFIPTCPIGELKLKGKAKPVMVYGALAGQM